MEERGIQKSALNKFIFFVKGHFLVMATLCLCCLGIISGLARKLRVEYLGYLHSRSINNN